MKLHLNKHCKKVILFFFLPSINGSLRKTEKKVIFIRSTIFFRKTLWFSCIHWVVYNCLLKTMLNFIEKKYMKDMNAHLSICGINHLFLLLVCVDHTPVCWILLCYCQHKSNLSQREDQHTTRTAAGEQNRNPSFLKRWSGSYWNVT